MLKVSSSSAGADMLRCQKESPWFLSSPARPSPRHCSFHCREVWEDCLSTQNHWNFYLLFFFPHSWNVIVCRDVNAAVQVQPRVLLRCSFKGSCHLTAGRGQRESTHNLHYRPSADLLDTLKHFLCEGLMTASQTPRILIIFLLHHSQWSNLHPPQRCQLCPRALQALDWEGVGNSYSIPSVPHRHLEFKINKHKCPVQQFLLVTSSCVQAWCRQVGPKVSCYSPLKSLAKQDE